MNELDAIFNYYDRYAEAKSNTNAGAGSNTLSSTNVPAGQIWVVKNMVAFNDSTAISSLTMYFYDGSTIYRISGKISPARSEYLVWTGKIVLKEGDSVRNAFGGCVAGDDIYFDLLGYKMRLK